MSPTQRDASYRLATTSEDVGMLGRQEEPEAGPAVEACGPAQEPSPRESHHEVGTSHEGCKSPCRGESPSPVGRHRHPPREVPRG